jgi:peroxisomal membrane protein 4
MIHFPPPPPGGFIAFGESKGVSGSVNLQLVLYLFARGIQGFIQSAVKRGYLPDTLSWTTPFGFRIWAGVSLAMALYLTDYEGELLSPSFLSTMRYLYQKSDSGALFLHENSPFLPFIVTVSMALLLGWIKPEVFGLDALLSRFIDPWWPAASSSSSSAVTK